MVEKVIAPKKILQGPRTSSYAKPTCRTTRPHTTANGTAVGNPHQRRVAS